MDGIIIVNKEKGWTSNDVVQKIKKIYNKKVGHAGTLDPLACGVLPILVGQGTSLCKYMVNHDKEYITTIKLGEKRSTGDEEGECIETKIVTQNMLNKDYVTNVLKTFQGKQEQIPPMYSAIKVNGKKLYEYARKGQTINIEPRKIEIYNIELISISKTNQEITFKVECSKGTYIRTLSEDIATKLGTVGYVKELLRTKVGEYSLENAITISDIKENKNKIITIEQFFNNNKKIIIDDNKLKQFLNGVKIDVEENDGIYKIYNEKNIFIGTGIINKNKMKRDICIKN